MPDSSYNSNPNVMTLADALGQDPDLVGKVWSRQLREGASQVDDFAAFEGGERDQKPFVVKRDLNAKAGDEIRFTVMSDVAGPGVRGEKELTGNTSNVDFHSYTCKVDFWRDAFEPTKKQMQFLAAGGSVKSEALKNLRNKLGRQRMYDMKMALKLLGVGNTVRPNGKRSKDTLTAGDTMSPSLLPIVKPQLQRLGGKPFMVSRNKHGSPVYSYMAYIPDVAMVDIRNSSTYDSALRHAADRGGDNPVFNGRLLDWQGIGLFEHITIDPDWDDKLSDPLAPRAVLGKGFGVDSDAADCVLIVNESNERSRYFEWFPGFKYEWWEGQAPASESSSFWGSFYNHATTGIAGSGRSYYAWLVNPDGSVGFVRYAGNANSGNKITLNGILNPDNTADGSGLGFASLGNFVSTGNTWGLNTAGNAYTRAAGSDSGSANCSPDFKWASSFDAGAYIIPCNANGAPEMYSLMLAQHAAVRAYVGEDKFISQERDYGFVSGFGYETIFGQSPCQRTDGKTNGYLLIEHTGQHQGLEVPALTE
ncbi:MAG TPA: DUF4043 family protein [Prosthecobacter sp.]|nr:DUF4043 family protein [Prosthecobacter sp.]